MDKKKLAIIGCATVAGLVTMIGGIFVGKEVRKKMAEKKSISEETTNAEEDA